MAHDPLPSRARPCSLAPTLVGRLVSAGFPSAADDYLSGEIDLGRYLIERPAASYVMRVTGPSMSGAGILDGDLVVVDRSLEPSPGRVVVAVVPGETTIKRLHRLKDGRTVLKAEHPDYPARPRVGRRPRDGAPAGRRRRDHGVGSE